MEDKWKNLLENHSGLLQYLEFYMGFFCRLTTEERFRM
jgi:hypothetical protein